jgi:hypothetical protein
MLLRARVSVYFRRQVARKKGTFAAFGSSHPGPPALPVEAQEPHVAGITSVRPNKKDAEKNALDKSSPIKTPYSRAVALRALIHFLANKSRIGIRLELFESHTVIRADSTARDRRVSK